MDSMTEAREIGAFQQSQRLQQDWSLAPRAASKDFEIAKVAPLGRANRRAILGEVFGREQPALLFHEGDDFARDVAAVERVARRFEPGLAAARGSSLLLVGHILQ